MTKVQREVMSEVRSNIADLLSTMEAYALPGFYQMEPDWETGKIEVSWMLGHGNASQDIAGTRKVLSAFPGHWYQHPGSSVREPIWMHTSTRFEITVFSRQGAIDVEVVIPK